MNETFVPMKNTIQWSIFYKQMKVPMYINNVGAYVLKANVAILCSLMLINNYIVKNVMQGVP